MVKKFRKEFIDVFEIPEELVGNVPVVIMTGKKEVIVENHKGIAEFTKERIILDTNDGAFLISGQNLSIKYMKSDCISICGNICAVGYDNL